MVTALYAVILAAVAFAGDVWLLVALGVSLVFAVLNPLACAFRSAWWLETIVSGAFFLGTLMLYQALHDMGALRLREDAMVFLAPVLLYLVAVPVSGIVRAARWKRAPRA